MVRKLVLAGALVALAFGVGRPAAADPKFLEEYGDIFGARPLLDTGDTTPLNALQGQAEKGKDLSFFVSPFFRRMDVPGGDVWLAGGGVGVNGGTTGAHPWQVYADFFNTRGEPDFGDSFDRFGWDVVGKFGVWDLSKKARKGFAPVVSVFGRYQDIQSFGHRWDVGLAVDQKVANTVYLTGNLGWAEGHPRHFGSQSDIVPGVGLTWAPMRRVSLSADYVVDNDVDGGDSWSVNAAYKFGRDLSARIGGGEHDTLFGNLIWRFGAR